VPRKNVTRKRRLGQSSESFRDGSRSKIGDRSSEMGDRGWSGSGKSKSKSAEENRGWPTLNGSLRGHIFQKYAISL
jgi:hypothetical protein